MATLFVLPVCQSLKNKLHPRKPNTHTANKEMELPATELRESPGQRTMGENAVRQRGEEAVRCKDGEKQKGVQPQKQTSREPG